VAALRLDRLLRHRNANTIRRRRIPPITPPAMAPIGLLLLEDPLLIGARVDVGATLEVGAEDVEINGAVRLGFVAKVANDGEYII
jgi:hypothetical protein